jgi:hypothetical protein
MSVAGDSRFLITAAEPLYVRVTSASNAAAGLVGAADRLPVA